MSQLHKALTEAFVQNILLCDKESIAFFHDQVQAASASFMDAGKKRQIHQQIAQAFIADIPTGMPWEELPNLFAIVEHLGEGREQNAVPEQRLLEAKFNHAAGITAMRALAMENANFFFQQALQLFPDLDWTKHYSFLFSLHKYLARSEMALGNQNTSEIILNTLIKQSGNDSRTAYNE